MRGKTMDMGGPLLLVNGSFVGRRVTGTQRYAIEMTRSLLAQGVPLRVLLLKDTPRPDWLPEAACEWLPSLGQARLARFIVNGLIAPLWVAGKYRGRDYVVWSPCNVGSPLFPNHVVTIHDMTIRAGPEWFARAFVGFYRVCFMAFSVQRVGVITDSVFSAKEIAKYYPPLARDTVVIRCGVDPVKAQTISRPAGLAGDVPFVLSVASKDPRKNLGWILESWRKRKAAYPSRLVLVGGGSEVFRRMNEGASDGGGSDMVDLGYVSDAELAWLYRHCHAVVMASLYEGFGLPATEALVQGARVICSDIPPFREAAGDAARYFKLGDRAGFLAAVDEVFALGRFTGEAPRLSTWAEVAKLFADHLTKRGRVRAGRVI